MNKHAMIPATGTAYVIDPFTATIETSMPIIAYTTTATRRGVTVSVVAVHELGGPVVLTEDPKTGNLPAELGYGLGELFIVEAGAELDDDGEPVRMLARLAELTEQNASEESRLCREARVAAIRAAVRR